MKPLCRENAVFRGIQILFASGFFLFGLFHEYVACIYGGLYGILCMAFLIKHKSLTLYLNLESVAIWFLAMMYLFSAVYGVDSGMGSIGFFKFLLVPLFLCCVMQMEVAGRRRLLGVVPWVGCFMVAVGIISYMVPFLYGFFFTADRLGGFFQYANVFALFCLCGIIVLAADGIGRKEAAGMGAGSKVVAGLLVQMAVLMAGVFLSGSRTVMILLVLSCLVLAAGERRLRVPLMLMLGLAMAAGFLYVYFTGNFQNIGRFLTISLKSSTFLGRILYWKDGLRLVVQHPFGLGYMGYYYMEPSIQTGIYSVRYIHNDFLQIMLDVGVLPGVLVFLAFGRNIFAKGRKSWQRLLIIVIGIQCFLDFSLEFTAIWLVAVLSLDICRGRELRLGVKEKGAKGKNIWKKICLAVLSLLSICSIYLGIAMIPRYVGRPEMSRALLPFYTEAGVDVLAGETDPAKAEALAEKLIRQNKYVTEACDVLGIVAYQRGDYQAMVQYKKQSLWLQKYNMEAYERYVILMSQAIARLGEEGDLQGAERLMNEVAAVPERLNEVADTTDDLAYQIRDVPDFTLTEEVSAYIEQVTEILNQ